MRVRGIMILVACMTLGACGVKPSNLSSLEGNQERSFPRTYPDLSNDPALQK